MFERIDKNRNGKLNMNEIFEWFNETPTKIAKVRSGTGGAKVSLPFFVTLN